MDAADWKESIIKLVRNISDEGYQRQAWFGKGDLASSPEEMFCQLFDDLMLEEFLTSEDVGLNEEQRRAGEALRNAMNGYTLPRNAHPSVVFGDPLWDRIRKDAAVFARALES